MKRITSLIIIALIIHAHAFTQPITKIINISDYYQGELSKSKKYLELLVKDSFFIKKYSADSISQIIRQINSFNEEKYLWLMRKGPSYSTVELFWEEIDGLQMFNFCLEVNKERGLAISVDSMINEMNRLSKSRHIVSIKDSLNERFFSRGIKLFVISRKNNNKLDTLPCYTVRYYKQIPFSINNIYCNSTSYPCDKPTRVSIGKNYTFIITIKGEEHWIEDVSIPPGRSKNDILNIPLIMTKNE